jgi:IclR family pca regulon transcriptional regulator
MGVDYRRAGTLACMPRTRKRAYSPGGETLRTLARGLALLECFTPQHPTLSHSEIVAATRLPQATVARFLKTLKCLGYLSQSEDRRYQLTIRALRLTQPSLHGLALPSWLFSQLERLAQRTGELWEVGVLDGQDIVTVSFGGGSMYRGDMPLGVRVPAFTGAAAVLAFSPRTDQERFMCEAAARHGAFDAEAFRSLLISTRRRGFAVGERHDWDPPIAVLAAPVWDTGSSPVAVVCVSSPLARRNQAAIRHTLARELLDLARAISEELGAASYPPSGEVR